MTADGKHGYYEGDIKRVLLDYCKGYSVSILLVSERNSTKYLDLNAESMEVLQDYFALLQHGVDIT